ncbi:MAG: hypothetical protein U0003_01250 [Vampirovibrionales bacterium]
MASVPHIYPQELPERQKNIEAMMAAQIKEWETNKERYPDSYTISLDASDKYQPNRLMFYITKCQSQPIQGFIPILSQLRVKKNVFSLVYAPYGEFIQKIAARLGLVSPEKHLKNVLKQVDKQFQQFIHSHQ